MGRYMESIFLNQFLSGGQAWLHAAFLSSILIAVMFRPQSVRSRGLLVTSIVFFAASLIVPRLFLQSTLARDKSRDNIGIARRGEVVEQSRKAADRKTTAIRWSMVSGPILFGISMVLATIALLPSGSASSRAFRLE